MLLICAHRGPGIACCCVWFGCHAVIFPVVFCRAAALTHGRNFHDKESTVPLIAPDNNLM